MTVSEAQIHVEELIDFPTLFQRQVERSPDRIAVIQDDRELTYRQLHELATGYARALLDAGMRHGARVGMCMERSPEAIAAMLGIMACGGAFVPLDPEYPADRIAYMIQDAEISLIVVDAENRLRLETDAADCQVSAGVTWVTDPDPCCEVVSRKIDPNELAYIMYTSGSTGKPKGVQIEHRALAAYCYADIDIYQVTAEDRTLQFSTLCFDIAIEEIFPPLLIGSCIVVRPKDRSVKSNELSDIVNRHQVTAIHLATAYWHEWVDLMVAQGEHVPESIRLMIVTGEKVSVQHYRRWQSRCPHPVLWCNAYGPTEATVSCTVFVPERDFDQPNMPIGKPMKRYRAYVLDDQLRPVAEGQTGQLFIGGPALARGYLNRPDLTDAAFVEVNMDGETKRLYRTGDVARWLPDGNIEFGGRIDHQIKLGSYRIEPAEIESVLDKHPDVLESLVSYDEIDSTKYLVAYIATGDANPTAQKVASFLREQLPAYMIPVRYVWLTKFPKTINGKIDRKALPCPSTGDVPRDDSYCPPRDELERELVEVFQQVLNVPQVGIHDDFFLLGGSSLLVTQVIARLSMHSNLELPVRDFFANPTVALAAKQIRQLAGVLESEASQEDDQRQRREQLPLVHAQFIEADDANLFSVRYEPRTNRRSHGVVICGALGHEYQRAYRNLQQLSLALCQDGFDVLRFDYRGTGNSDGDATNATVSNMENDIRYAIEHLRRSAVLESVSLLGVRLGATVAAQTSHLGVDKIICWDPIVDGESYLKLLNGFHQHALTSLTYFNRRRKRSGIDQLFGEAMGPEKRQLIKDLRFPERPRSDQGFVILSAGYRPEMPSETTSGSAWTSLRAEDEIRWWDHRYTESAFSSPGVFQLVQQTLTETGDE